MLKNERFISNLLFDCFSVRNELSFMVSDSYWKIDLKLWLGPQFTSMLPEWLEWSRCSNWFFCNKTPHTNSRQDNWDSIGELINHDCNSNKSNKTPVIWCWWAFGIFQILAMRYLEQWWWLHYLRIKNIDKRNKIPVMMLVSFWVQKLVMRYLKQWWWDIYSTRKATRLLKQWCWAQQK